MDKLKLAFSSVNKKLNKVDVTLAKFKECKTKLATGIIANSFNAKVGLTRYDKCTEVIECRLKLLKYQLRSKRIDMETELKMEKAGFGNSYVSGKYEPLPFSS